MIVLYLYPQMFGLPDNNPFGLKVETFLRLAKIDFEAKHSVDTKEAPRGQLPYIDDNGKIITDSNYIIHYLSEKFHVQLDKDLTPIQKTTHFLMTRMLDSHLYWVMSYSRWQDERYWPLFKAEFLSQFPHISQDILEKARKYNIEKYHYQGIGRYEAKEIYESGIEDLSSIAAFLGENDFIFGNKPHSIDAVCYGFLANIYYFDINTPLKDFMVKEAPLKKYINRVRALLNY